MPESSTRPALQVLSFPKSGRTWLRVMLDEAQIPARYSHLGWGHRQGRLPADLKIEIRPGFKGTVALFRDPRDTIVSGYYQATARIGKYHGSISDFLRAPGYGLAKLMTFNFGLATLCSGRPDCLLVTYEAMLEDAAPILVRIAELAGVSLPADRAQAIVANNTFDRMQERERSSEYHKRYGDVFATGAGAAPEQLKVRRGVAGGYRDELSPEDIAYCDDLLARSGYFDKMSALLGVRPPAQTPP